MAGVPIIRDQDKTESPEKMHTEKQPCENREGSYRQAKERGLRKNENKQKQKTRKKNKITNKNLLTP